jgi:hypothetical protein
VISDYLCFSSTTINVLQLLKAKSFHLNKLVFSGVGKTTLVQKVCKVLLERQVPLNGFYTEEERDPVSKKRIGFSIVTVDGKRGTLSNVK